MEQIRAHVSQLCRGWPADRVREIVARHLEELIVPYVYDEARALLDAHRAAGEDVIIVSTSGVEMVGPIGALLGAALVIATQMEIADGRYTGQMDFYAYGPAKAERVRELAGERGYRLADCSAYSDSITDLPMLEAVGHPHAVNPDRALRRLAQLRGWPVLAFSALPPGPAAAAAGRDRPPVEVPPRNGTRGIDRDEESVRPRASPAAASAVERCQGQTSWHGSRVPTRPGPEEGGRGGDVAGAPHLAQTRGPVTARHHEAQLGSPVCRARPPAAACTSAGRPPQVPPPAAADPVCRPAPPAGRHAPSGPPGPSRPVSSCLSPSRPRSALQGHPRR